MATWRIPRHRSWSAVGRLAVSLVCGLLLFASRAGAYSATANTGPDAATIDTTLFVSASTMTAAPVGHWLWFVADVNLDGVPTAPAANQLLDADDHLISAEPIDGTLLGDQAGRFNRASIVVDDAYATANIIVYLWNVLAPTVAGQAGQTFGVVNLGVVGAPGFGEAEWVISNDLFADQYTVLDAIAAAVPEPSTIILLLAGGMVIGWVGRQRAAGRFDGGKGRQRAAGRLVAGRLRRS